MCWRQTSIAPVVCNMYPYAAAALPHFAGIYLSMDSPAAVDPPKKMNERRLSLALAARSTVYTVEDRGAAGAVSASSRGP
jgi:hypothetical protein